VIVESTNNHDIRSSGQKEDIFGDENPEQELDKKQETKQLAGSKFSAAATADNDDDDKLNAPVAMDEQAISREPVAHAIVQPANGGQGPHDSIADIYLTGAVRNDKSTLILTRAILKLCI